MVMAVTNAVDVAAENARLKAELASARAELTGAKLLIEQLRAQLAVLRRMQFGRSSEKLDLQIAQLELTVARLNGAIEVFQRTRPNRRSADTDASQVLDIVETVGVALAICSCAVPRLVPTAAGTITVPSSRPKNRRKTWTKSG